MLTRRHRDNTTLQVVLTRPATGSLLSLLTSSFLHHLPHASPLLSCKISSVPVELIWRARLSFPKLLFLFNRYVVPASLILLTYAISGLSDDILPDSLPNMVRCRHSGRHAIYRHHNFLILLRLWVLWDRKTRLVLVTLTLFLVTQITSIVCTAYVVSSMMRELSYDWA
ncbi:hypothetical protein EDB19DRAFT_244743 [Suillus lakei]|nr:hypothetical protein EDB19DRAFT_244743 [Suillus lakei]